MTCTAIFTPSTTNKRPIGRAYETDNRKGKSVRTLHSHVVFTPNYRRGPFTDQILTRCEAIMHDLCDDFGVELIEFNGERDHVHLLVHYPPKVSISKLAGSLKGVSPACCAKNSTPTSAHTCGETTSGHPPTSPPAAAEHPCHSSPNTSTTRNVPAKHNPGKNSVRSTPPRPKNLRFLDKKGPKKMPKKERQR